MQFHDHYHPPWHKTTTQMSFDQVPIQLFKSNSSYRSFDHFISQHTNESTYQSTFCPSSMCNIDNCNTIVECVPALRIFRGKGRLQNDVMSVNRRLCSPKLELQEAVI